MRMNVRPIPTASDRINQIRELTARIVNHEILPHENDLWVGRRGGEATEASRRRAHELRAGVRESRSPRGPRSSSCGRRSRRR